MVQIHHVVFAPVTFPRAAVLNFFLFCFLGVFLCMRGEAKKNTQYIVWHLIQKSFSNIQIFDIFEYLLFEPPNIFKFTGK